MGARISFMSADVATPRTNEWQAVASSFAADSATLIARLLILFIFITIAACGLHLHMRKRCGTADTGEDPQEGVQINDLHSAEGPTSLTGIFCSWERSQAVEDKYLRLILLLCSREVANLPYPTLWASSLSDYMFCFCWLKPKHKTT
ncbi:unnamed protein product [Sphagnum troendelagicum]